MSVSCLPQRMLLGNVKTLDVIFKKMTEEIQGRLSWRWRVIVCLFLARNTILNLTSPKGSVRCHKLLLASLLLAAVSIFFQKHIKRRVRKQSFENRYEFFDFILLKQTFR